MDPTPARISRRLVLKGGITVAGLAAGGALAGLPAVVEAADIGPKTFEVLSGGSSRDQALQLNYYFPKEIFVNQGDTVRWKWTAMEPHTVTFPVGSDPWPNPFALPPAGIGGSIFDGTATVSSGLVAAPATYSLTFDTTGTFEYVCLLHSAPNTAVMRGTVHVLPTGSARPFTQADYTRMGRQQMAAALKVGNGLLLGVRRASMQREDGKRLVAAGGDVGDGDIALMRFVPQWINVRKGETLRFKNVGAVTPHTVTFGEEPQNVFLPVGDPSNFTGGALNSGLLWGAAPPPGLPSFGATFDVTFNQLGRFPYICALHDEMGMVGVVTVTR